MEHLDAPKDDQNCLPGFEALKDSRAGENLQAGKELAPPRLRRPDRDQALMQPVMVDELIPQDHQARTLWLLIQRMDLSGYEGKIKARDSDPGRATNDPRLMITLWTYAATQGVSSARELDRLCECQDVYRWICGGVEMNYHSLSDFRVNHREELEGLFIQGVMKLVQLGLVVVERISQDGMRVRASAGSSSFRKGSTLKRLEQEAREHLEKLKAQEEDPAVTARQAAARERAAREQLERIQEALAQVPGLQKTKDDYGNRKAHAQQQTREPRSSTTDPEARVMKMPDGGCRPAYNVQLATAVGSRAIVGVDVVNIGSDRQQSQPMREQVEKQTQEKVIEHLIDGGFVRLEDIEKAGEQGVTTYAPRPKTKEAVDPAAPKKGDGPHVIEWRKRMGEPEAKEIYKERAATSETVNADLKTYRGMDRLGVRGIDKVKCVALWGALAYNLMHFGTQMLG